MSLFSRKKKSTKTLDHQLTIGLGTALRRLEALEKRRRSGAASDNDRAELAILYDALNTIPLTLRASCVPGEDFNKDGKADTVQFFELMATTDCCTLQHPPETRSGGGKAL